METTKGAEAQRFMAAKESRLDSPMWGKWGEDYNRLVATDSPILRRRVRGLVRNFPPFVRAIDAHCAYVIGKGGRFESRAVKKNGKEDKRLRDEIERRFRLWMERATVDGRTHFHECQRLAMRQRLETGEFFCLTRVNRRGELALQFVEPDDVAEGAEQSSGYQINDEVCVYQGIEFNRFTGERLAYYVKPYDPRGVAVFPIRFGADKVLHGMGVGRPNQLRGVTPFAPAIILAECMFEYIDAELDGAKMAAKWLAFVTSPEPKALQLGRVLDQHGRPATGSEETKKIEYLENGIIEYLRTGETVQLASAPNRVVDSFDRFTAFVLRMIGLTIGVPYEIMSGDYQGINYSTSRMSRQDYNVFLEPERFWMDQHFNRPVFRKWLEIEALKDPETFKDYFINPWRYEPADWIPAGMPSPDPLKEGKADIDAIEAGLLSPQDVILARGDDPERVVENRKKWKELEEEHGVASDPGKVSTAAQTNPDALYGDEKEGDDEGEKARR
jgi:lambda family phage portal protein